MRHLIFAVALILAGCATYILWERYGPAPVVPDLAASVDQIDGILIEKSARRLTAFKNGTAVLSYDMALGFAPKGDKQIEGDGKTPEGEFLINRRNPNSAYRLSLGINYPLADDIALAKSKGIDPGGDIFIHGQPNGVGSLLTLPGDWTAGCIALSDAEIEELWRVTTIGTKVEIVP